MPITSVLLAHDGSALSGAIVDAVRPWLGTEVEVTLIHVDDGAPADPGALEAAAASIADAGSPVTRLNEQSADAAAAILDAAKRLHPSLVAMSTHGRSGVARWVRGSVAERVLRGCPVPVFMVNPTTKAEARISSVLVPLDASENAAEVLDVLLPLAKAFSARVTLLFVDWNDPTDTPAMLERRRAERAADIRQWLSGPSERVRDAGLDVEVRIAHGDVAEQIIALAQPEEHDLLAMATHGRSGPGRWLLGSIAEKVLRECRIPVLLHRAS